MYFHENAVKKTNTYYADRMLSTKSIVVAHISLYALIALFRRSKQGECRMAAHFATDTIKLEGVDGGENVTEIQSYLEGFQKEIEGGEGTVIQQVAGKTNLLCCL